MRRTTFSISILLWSAESRPLITLTTIGKKEIVAAIAIFDARPKPNQMTNSGATATFGIVWNAMM